MINRIGTCLSIVATFAATSGLAQDANRNAERHLIVASIFNLACMKTAPDLTAAEAVFLENGLTEEEEGVFVGHNKEFVGFISTGANGRTRTCALGLAYGTAETLDTMLDQLSSGSWGEAGQKVENQDGFPVYVQVNEGFAATMTVGDGDPVMPIMNHVSFAPEGFGE